jgi:hypothetical protein
MSLFRHHVTFLFGDKVPHWPRAHHIGGQPGGGGGFEVSTSIAGITGVCY